MRRPVRVGLVVLGAAMAVYGVAARVGWWPSAVVSLFVPRPVGSPRPTMSPIDLNESPQIATGNVPMSEPELERLRAWAAADARAAAAHEERSRTDAIAQMAAGLALVAVGAWPRRRKAAAS